MSSIYTITNDIKALDQLIDEVTTDENGDPKQMSDEDRDFLKPMLDELETNYEAKAENILKYHRNLLAYIDGCKAEEERIYKRRKAAENKTKALIWLLEDSMRKLGAKKMTAGTFTMTIQKNPPSAYIYSEAQLPPEFLRIIPEKREPDKKLILEALKAGQNIPGAKVSQGESLKVR